MISTWFTWRALANEWDGAIRGLVLRDVYSQEKSELVLALDKGDSPPVLKIGIGGSLRHGFLSTSHRKARKNVAELFPDIKGARVTAVRIAERDRLLYIETDSDFHFRILPFGPRPNCLLVGADGSIVDAFKHGETLAGTRAPEPRPAPIIDSIEAVRSRWKSQEPSLAHAVTKVFPLCDRNLATEIVHLAGLTESSPQNVSDADFERILTARNELEVRLKHPEPRIYRDNQGGLTFALVPLQSHTHGEETEYVMVSEAVFHFVRFSHIHNAFRRRFENLERVLSGSAKRLRKRADDMKSTLSKPARADRYEKFGHLLMANAHTITRGLDLVTLPNILASGDEVDIPLDASLTAVENAQAYYDRARRSREARLHADRRLERAKMEATDAEMLLAELQDIEELRQLDVFEKTHASRLQAIRGNETGGQAKVPFRTYRVAGDLEVWVGRNARQNDQLTLRHARKFDIWMHARGVPGSHVVLRLPNRDYRVGREAIEQAAAIAAWWSDARPSAFAPVIFTERKFVRKPRGAHPGAVRVEREEVVMVEPGLPGDSQSEA